MSEALVIDIGRDAVLTALMISAPALIIGMVVGLVISIFQATTQIQEQTLTFVPKLIGVAVIGLITAKFMNHTVVGFTERIFAMIANISH